MSNKEYNELTAGYFSELVFRARRVGRTITRIELADYLAVDGSLISHWLNGSKMFDENRLEKVCNFIAKYEYVVTNKEIVEKTKKLVSYIETFNKVD